MASIRPATRSDEAEIAGLLAQLGHPAAAGGLGRRLAALVYDERSAVLVAEEDGAVAGVLILSVVPVLHEDAGWCRVSAMVVDEARRGRGIGRTLLEAAEEHARAAGCSRIEATSAIRREDAHRFYRAAGYAEQSRHFLKRFTR